MVASAERPADLRQRGVGELAREVHRHLPWINDVLGATLATELVPRDAEALRHDVLDLIREDRSAYNLVQELTARIKQGR
jgi:hypothetical protein